MIDFDGINKALNIVQVAAWLGLKVGRMGSCYCPFHSDKHLGNFKVSESKQMFKCFACGESGDSVTLTAKLKGVSNGDAARLLNDAFNLNLIRSYTREERIRHQERRGFDVWRNAVYARLKQYIAAVFEDRVPMTYDPAHVWYMIEVVGRGDADECRMLKERIEAIYREALNRRC